jgi:hypothetical protein
MQSEVGVILTDVFIAFDRRPWMIAAQGLPVSTFATASGTDWPSCRLTAA